VNKIPVGVLGASGYAGRELCALLAQHPVLLGKLPPHLLESIDDLPARALIAGAIKHRVLDGRAIEEAAPEIRKAAAQALLSDEFDKVPNPDKALAQIATQLAQPRDRAALDAARRAAIASGDMELARTLNARILAATRAQ